MQPHPESVPIAAAPVLENARTITARDYLHPQWYIRAILYLVAFLHTKHRVTFRASALILICLGFIFSVLVGDLIGAVAMPRTLKTVFARFEMKDNFVVHPICFQCQHVFEPDINVNTFCPDCDEEVFGGPSRDSYDAWENADADSEDSPDPQGFVKRKPYMVSPIQPLSAGLHEFFKRPGMVAAVESWRTRPQVAGELRCMQDGEIWKTTKDANGDSLVRIQLRKFV